MGRWSHLDSDEERLPEGMTRVGYDADTQVYTYRDSDGSYWEGAPGCQYGKLRRVSPAAPRLPSAGIPDDVEGGEPAYALFDKDSLGDSSFCCDDDDTTVDGHDEYCYDAEKRLLGDGGAGGAATSVAAPERARVRLQSPAPSSAATKTAGPQPRLSQKLPSLPGAEAGSDKRSSSRAQAQSQPPPQQSSRGLRRSGTLSRIGRFLSFPLSLSNGSNNDNRNGTMPSPSSLLRRATLGRGANSPPAPGRHRQAAGDAVPRPGTQEPWKRATTFEEILGRMGQA